MGIYLNEKIKKYDIRGKHRAIINGMKVYKDYRGLTSKDGVKSKKLAKKIDDELRED